MRFHTAPVTSLVFAPDAGTLTSADIIGTTATWAVGTGARLRSQTAPGRAAGGPWQVIAGYTGEPIFVEGKVSGREQRTWPTLTAHAGVLLIRDGDGVGVFDLKARKMRTFDIARSSWNETAISPDGRILALPDNGDLVRLFDLGTGKELRSVATKLNVAHGCFSPDQDWLAVSGDKGIEIWHTATATRVASFHGHRGTVASVAFSPDGSTLVSAGVDGTLVAWDVATLLAKSRK
jgi:WD40 repeat protein